MKIDTLDFIVKKYHLDPKARSPIDIPNVGRDNLAELFSELKFKVGVEIGTERGIFAEKLCQANPKLKLFCVDPWLNYPGYPIFEGMMAKNYREAKKRLSKYNCHLIRKLSLKAVQDFKDESLDFVFIDGNHDFQNVVNDLVEWSKKVKMGGIICGHDYIREKRHGNSWPRTSIQVVEAVTGFTIAYDIQPWFLLGSQWPKPGEIRDQHRSFMWVRGKHI